MGKWIDNLRVAFMLVIIVANIGTSIEKQIGPGWGILMVRGLTPDRNLPRTVRC